MALNTPHPQNVAPLLIADWEVLPDRNLVRRSDAQHALEPRLVQVLVHLASRPGEVVSRTELLELVWGETVVQEEALTQAVSQLRRVMGDDPKNPTIIETVPKRGYRLVAEVRSGGETEKRTTSIPRWPLLIAAVVLVAVVGVVLQRGEQAPVVVSLLDTRPLTSLPGDEGHPAVSPDGTMVAFTWLPELPEIPENGEEYKLHLKRLDSETLTALTDEPGHEFNPVWSPDGERLAFERRTAEGRQVCVVAAIGGPVQELGPVHWLMGGLDWSPDGRSIAYSAKDEQEAPMRLLRLDVADGRVDTLTHPEDLSRGDTFPRYSPDGKQLALVRSDRGINRRIHLMPAVGGEPEGLADPFFSCGGLDWAPDGKALVLSATLRGTFELFRVDVRNGTVVPMPARIHRSMSPSWRVADGPLVFTDNALDADLVVGRFDGADEQSVASSTRIDMTGRFSPDGRSILFISDRGGSRELWLLDRIDGSVRSLSAFGGDALRKPRWSPDGRRVAVNVGREGLLQIVVIDVASGLQLQATSGPIHHRLGHWSADGQSLFYSREKGADWQIARVRFDGTDAKDVPMPGCATLHQRPNGQLLYFKETEDGLFLGPGPEGEERIVDPESMFDLMNLQVSDTGYWFIRRSPEGAFLAYYDFATGTVDDRATLAGRPTGEFHVSFDEKEFVYTSIVNSANDLVIVDDPR